MISSVGMSRQRRDGRTEHALRRTALKGWREMENPAEKSGREGPVRQGK